MRVDAKTPTGLGPSLAPKQTRGARVSGIDRAIQILDYLRDNESPASAYAVAKAIGAPLSTIYTIIDDLAEKQLLQRRSDGSIWLGPRLYHYGLAYARSLDFLDVATHEMQELCRDVEETIQICGRDDDHMVVMAMADGPGHFRVISRVGTRVPLNWTASGRLLAGHLPDAERLVLFQRAARVSPTGHAEINPKALSDASAASLKERLSIQISESDFSVACVASPICDASGACVATMSIVLPEHKVVQARDRYADAVRSAAARVETVLGWR
ncbi:IclR family transcriptional regulator [Microvirga puerhi]|uniref:IclR family transcriptional regulator n=1 Tax=Microvirga puerhi TaxID=2876078 RepID=A0ABS7VQF5_9HYPH|nr:IclR family transcriptional regulator [Microvirga puerhi]MBZ6077750.1 IclR family transcriptional regulator [Microvirga puerhi]